MNYKLNDIRVTVVGKEEHFNCSHRVGDGFDCRGENLYFNKQTDYFSHFALATLMPYIAAKQRVTDPNDWMQFEQDIACPDPQCAARFRFTQIGYSTYEYNVNGKQNKV